MKSSLTNVIGFLFISSSSILFSQKSSDLIYRFQGFELEAIVGYGQRFGKTPNGFDPSYEDYLKSLKRGFTLSFEGSYFFNDKWGAGLKYSLFANNKSFATSEVGPFFGDKTQIHYVAPQALLRTVSANNKHTFLNTFGIGYAAYRDDADVDGQEIKITGNNIALNTDLEYGYHFNDFAAFVVRVGFMVGSLGELTSEGDSGSQTIDLNDDNRESLTRLDFSGGFRLRL